MAVSSKVFIHCKGIVQYRKKPVHHLRGTEMGHLPILNDAYCRISEGKITAIGSMESYRPESHETVINARDRYLMPAFVDSHTHLVFAKYRESEFVDKINGLSYAEIAAKGGGILNSAKVLASVSEEELYLSALKRIDEIVATGTGSVEIKSGYGLSTEAELKMLKVIRKLREDTGLSIKSTFLGAHAIPQNRKRNEYIQEIIEEMIPRVAEDNLAEYIDVFCEKGFFSVEESETIIEAGKNHGLTPKIHANQLTNNGGVQLGIRTESISVDHLETISEEEIDALGNSKVIATLLPGAAFYLRMSYPPARDLMNANAMVAVASDYNPGSSPSGNMQTMLSLACIGMKMTPSEAINAMTINTAAAMELPGGGQIYVGGNADLILTKKIPSVDFIPYSFGSNHVHEIYIGGEKWTNTYKETKKEGDS